VSLFDVIRYPVSDIYDADAISEIPEEITLPWAKECRDRLKLNSTREEAFVPARIANWVGWMIFVYCQDRDPETAEYMKKHFTHTLRERIKNYDNL